MHKEFVLDAFSDFANNKSLENLENRLSSFETNPYFIIFNFLSTYLKLQTQLITVCVNDYSEFVKISQASINRDTIFPTYFCLFDKIFSYPTSFMRETLLLKFKNQLCALNSQKMLGDFLREVLKSMNKFKSVHWVKDLIEKRLDWLDQEIKCNQNVKENWKMSTSISDLSEQSIKFEKFIRSDAQYADLKNMFNSKKEARLFAEKHSGHKKTYSCNIEALGKI